MALTRARPCPHAPRVHSSACVQGVYTGSVPGTRGLMREGGTSSYLKTPRLVRPFMKVRCLMYVKVRA